MKDYQRINNQFREAWFDRNHRLKKRRLSESLAKQAAACEHIYDYYNSLWQTNHQLGTNLLRKGYYKASRNIWHQENNLFEPAGNDH